DPYQLFVRYFFFFQAEDGIRDKLVTGVQTCALPISPFRVTRLLSGSILSTCRSGSIPFRRSSWLSAISTQSPGMRSDLSSSPRRSEERRVGKECRSRWWP